MEKNSIDIKRWTLILGVAQITWGCLIAFLPPSAVAWYRGLVMSHLEYTANGVLMVAFAFVYPEMELNKKSRYFWFWSLQLGTWTNGTAGLVGALLGASSTHLPSLNEKFPPPNGYDHFLVSGLLKFCGMSMMLALFLTLWGLLRKRSHSH